MAQDPTQRLLHQARFLKSAQNVEQCPPDAGFEVAFAGRSNAGKSSAINRLTGQRTLARTSKTPGRTQLLNFFELDEDAAKASVRTPANSRKRDAASDWLEALGSGSCGTVDADLGSA